MNRVLLFTVTLLVLLASNALAVGGVDINWGPGCWSDGTPINDLAFACNTNIGTATMTCSFATGGDRPLFVGIEADLEGRTESATVPDWWQLGVGQCRATAISTSENFLSAPQIGCVDVWADQAQGGLVSYDWGPLWGGNDRVHVQVAYAVPANKPIPLTADLEYYACQVQISYAMTVGAGSCTGCATPMNWKLCPVRVKQSDGSYEDLTEVLPGGNQCLRWQHSVLPCSAALCPLVDLPVRNSTWGQLKSFYR